MKPQCFVIMPFGNSSKNPKHSHMLDQIYSQWIKPTVESISLPSDPSVKIACHRADKTEMPGEIITHIIDRLVNADIVIADLSGQNPNVFYELGVRHAVHNNTILIAQNIADVPFDLRPLRTIEYSYDPENMLIFKKRLTDAISAVIKDRSTIDNPVRRYLYEKAVHDLVSQAAPPGFDAVRSMASELVSLRKDFENYAKQTREIMESLSSINQPKTTGKIGAESPLRQLEGIWKSVSGGTYCARLVEDRLYIPYCHRGSDHLTAHYFDFNIFGRTFVGQFEWFDSDVRGFAYFQLTSPRLIKGGWWYAHSVPQELRKDLSQLNDSIPGMRSSEWERQSTKRVFPRWAEGYFKNKLYENQAYKRLRFSSQTHG